MNKNLTVDGNVLIYNSTLEKVDGEVAHVDWICTYTEIASMSLFRE